MKTKTRGFTLIEMLVVIAIIALLAAILLPVIQNALLNAQAAATGMDANSIHKAVVASTLSQPNYASDVTAGLYPASDSDPNALDVARYDSSTEYFTFLVTNQVLDVPWGFFSARGLVRSPGQWTPESQNDRGLSPDGNAWVVVTDAQGAPSSMPFLFTRNLTIDRLHGVLPPTTSLASSLQGAPFDSKRVVGVTIGGSLIDIGSNDLRQQTFNPPGVSRDIIRPDVAR